MKTINLNPDIDRKAATILNNTSKTNLPSIRQEKTRSRFRAFLGWFNHETPENLTFIQAGLRGGALILMPLILLIFDSSLHTDVLPFLVPVMFYLEVTAFTMYCPIKAFISTEKLPEQFD
ncbi:hypothetical protein ACTJKN_02160 [Pedobacter sp. 22163]|uniref:hypothetical protein n=1 Tax=Pedobacter sp. 22163 TaxID=3453883 RepID=UPI003F85613B